MARVEPTSEAVEVHLSLGRRASYYYEELASASASGGQLLLCLHDGRRVRARVGQVRAEALARQIEAIVGGTDDALGRTASLADLRREVANWLAQTGFAAAPFVDFLLGAAAALEASDLHLEPRSDGAHMIRLRLDGVLHDGGTLPPEQGRRALGRLKVMSGVKAHRVDVPQEGRAGVSEGGWVRMSFVPSVAGESATVRLFDQLKGRVTLEELGFGPNVQEGLRALLAEPRGVLLIAGPSASGKSTTLYTCLKTLIGGAGRTLRAITVEDPVEYRLDEVTQLEAAPARGNTGARLLRSVLRQDADVLAVGEVRDDETARLMVEAGLTGHRVVSTIHAGSAIEATLRLLELGLKPSAVGAALIGVLAQRLVRRRCVVCRGEGCETCHGTGYRGRIALGEVLLVDGAFREVLEARPTLSALSAAARSAGMVPLSASARALVQEGVTDEAEVARELGPSHEEEVR